jgi:hypothetical protein
VDSISDGVERGDATGVWYWKGLPTRTLVSEKQKCGPRHKSSKERLTVICCGNAYKLKLVIGKAKKNHGWSRVLKQTAFLYIITTRKVCIYIGRFCKIGSTRIFFQKFRLS